MESLTLLQPDDWHVHVREGAALQAVVPQTARQFARAMIMPNLENPIRTVEQALTYRQKILAALPPESSFMPYMTLYLTDQMTPAEVERAAKTAEIKGIKFYPAGATTHSGFGLRDLNSAQAVLEAMESLGVPLLVHGESIDPTVDIFDRERVFVEEILIPLVERYPSLRLVLEHITTAASVKFILTAADNVAATITPQHLLYNRNALFQGGIRPHLYCLPVLKREENRQALLRAVSSGHPRFFLGTDSAPHAQNKKETDCGCAGIYSAPLALELYAEAFESVGALSQLEGFASHYGADFYGLPRNSKTIRLRKQSWIVPEHYPLGYSDVVVPLRSGEKMTWQLEEI
jgi:dihydroorotase